MSSWSRVQDHIHNLNWMIVNAVNAGKSMYLQTSTNTWPSSRRSEVRRCLWRLVVFLECLGGEAVPFVPFRQLKLWRYVQHIIYHIVSILIMILLCTNIVFWLTFVAEMRCCFKQISVGMILRTQNLMFICANFLFCFKRNNFGRFSLSRQGVIGLLLMILHYKVCSKGWFQIPSTTRTESNSWSGVYSIKETMLQSQKVHESSIALQVMFWYDTPVGCIVTIRRWACLRKMTQHNLDRASWSSSWYDVTASPAAFSKESVLLGVARCSSSFWTELGWDWLQIVLPNIFWIIWIVCS